MTSFKLWCAPQVHFSADAEGTLQHSMLRQECIEGSRHKWRDTVRNQQLQRAMLVYEALVYKGHNMGSCRAGNGPYFNPVGQIVRGYNEKFVAMPAARKWTRVIDAHDIERSVGRGDGL